MPTSFILEMYATCLGTFAFWITSLIKGTQSVLCIQVQKLEYYKMTSVLDTQVISFFVLNYQMMCHSYFTCVHTLMLLLAYNMAEE